MWVKVPQGQLPQQLLGVLVGAVHSCHAGVLLTTAQNPTMARAREISALLLDGYDRGELKEIYVIYTRSAHSKSYR